MPGLTQFPELPHVRELNLANPQPKEQRFDAIFAFRGTIFVECLVER